MIKFFSTLQKKIHNVLETKSQTKTGGWWLGIISFTESSFFPIPPDPFLVASLLVKQNRWFIHSLIVSVASVLGAMFGYAIGFYFFSLFGDQIVEIYHLEDELRTVSELFEGNVFWTMFIAAFTPIPFKIFTIAGGLFQVSIIPFIIASILGRSLRFFSIGYIMKVFGKSIGIVVFKYFNILTAIVLLIVIGYALWSIL